MVKLKNIFGIDSTMDEILRSRRLAEEMKQTLERLKSFAVDTEERLTRLSSIKTSSVVKSSIDADQKAEATMIGDLPDDLLTSIISHLTFNHVKTCCLVDKRIRKMIVEGENMWRDACGRDYNIKDHATMSSLTREISLIRATGLHPSSTSQASIVSPKGTHRQWYTLYRDLDMAWSRVIPEMLTFLSSHGHPSTLSGSHHRRTLAAVLSILRWTTRDPIGDKERRELVLSSRGIRSLCSLVDNDSANAREKALGTLANLCSTQESHHSSSSVKSEVLVALRSGAKVTESLEPLVPEGVRKEAARLLVNSWSTSTALLAIGSSSCSAAYQSGDVSKEEWVLTQFTLRGEENCSKILLETKDELNGIKRFHGKVKEGGPISDEFQIEGSIVGERISFSTTGVLNDVIVFTGWTDGSLMAFYGTYQHKTSGRVFKLSKVPDKASESKSTSKLDIQ